MSKNISAFSGTTFDGHPWVLTFEGGPTALSPESCCRVSGRVGPSIKVCLGIEGGELRSLLPSLNLGEVASEIKHLRGF